MTNSKDKSEFYKITGKAILDKYGIGLYEKWCNLVDQLLNDNFVRDGFIDEVLQIMYMIELKISPEIIAQSLNSLLDGKKILREYLGQFIHPEILDEIDKHLNTKPIRK